MSGRCGVELPALQQLRVHGLLSAQRSLFAQAGRLALEGDALLHWWMAEGVGTPTELQAAFRVVIGESRRGAWRGVTGGLLILLGSRKATEMSACRYIYEILYQEIFQYGWTS